jgi:hypothetical protein
VLRHGDVGSLFGGFSVDMDTSSSKAISIFGPPDSDSTVVKAAAFLALDFATV